MDAETWNEKLRAMRAAGDRSRRVFDAHTSIGHAMEVLRDLGLDDLAAPLEGPYREAFTLACLAQTREGELFAELEAAHKEGAPPA
jgi:hypothetical protein